MSNAERRSLRLGEGEIVPRLSDVYAALPSITGKLELEYEGELVGAASIAKELIRRAADATLREHSATIDTDSIVMWFDSGGALQVTDEVETATMFRAFGTVPGLHEAVSASGLAEPNDAAFSAAACELVLESLVARRKVSRTDGGRYGRGPNEQQRRRPNQDLFGGGLSA